MNNLLASPCFYSLMSAAELNVEIYLKQVQKGRLLILESTRNAELHAATLRPHASATFTWTSKTSCAACDVYRGQIVICAGGVWRHASIAPGFVTVASNLEPNNHFVVLPEDELFDDIRFFEIDVDDLCSSPYVSIKAPIRSRLTSGAGLIPPVWCEFVRYGRVATGQSGALPEYADGPGAFGPDLLWRLVELDLDGTEVYFDELITAFAERIQETDLRCQRLRAEMNRRGTEKMRDA